MALRLVFPYKKPPGVRKSPTSERLYPLIPVVFYNSNSFSIKVEALLDSGADGILLPRGFAEELGLQDGGTIATSGVLSEGRVHRTQVGFKVGAIGPKSYDFGVVNAVYTSTERDIPVLIGRYPLFKKFRVIFEELQRERPRIVLEMP